MNSGKIVAGRVDGWPEKLKVLQGGLADLEMEIFNEIFHERGGVSSSIKVFFFNFFLLETV